MLLPRTLLLAAVCTLTACNSDQQQAGPRVARGATGADTEEGFELVFAENCAVCHGDTLQGAAQGVPLVGVDLQYGDSIEALSQSIAGGYPERGMPAWAETLAPESIHALAILIAEQRKGIVKFLDFNVYTPLVIPSEPISTELVGVKAEVVAEDLAPLPYSIAPLPDGRILLTEKMRGLSIISADGEQSALISGLPEFYNDAAHPSPENQLKYGTGWILDVALHPDYASNGWIYISYGDRCEGCNAASIEEKLPVSMNILIRGKLRNGAWVDQQVLWQTEVENYTTLTDVVAGGRIAFDHDGHVFMSVGMKGVDRSGIQDLSKPYGKIHRMYDDGGVPEDNPFFDKKGAVPTTWTYGHRSPQGLEFDPSSGKLWGTEMGPRGGDELNWLMPGGNFGWPLFSLGAEYDGRAVDDGERLGVEWSMADIQQPVVDLTPGPAVSSFVIYQGAAFPQWSGQFLVGSLKGTDFYRFEIEHNRLVHSELLFTDMGRIRDVEVGPQGRLYLLLEHSAGSKIVRLKPVLQR
jgi:glucose/arabinose dehydrogenase/cytochrome c553